MNKAGTVNMTGKDMLKRRLGNQQIAGTDLSAPEEIVSHLGAMQAQVYPMAKWAIGLRLLQATDSMVEKAFTEGRVLRTHLLRPTWHFVTPGDIRWMLALTAPRVHALNLFYYRKFELDKNVFRRTNAILVKQLRDGNYLTREALNKAFSASKIKAAGVRLACIMMYAELEGIICSGPRQGKQFSYALLEERVPPVPSISRTEALALLSHKYFASRGPATLQDFVTWSGLTMKDAKEGAAMLPRNFEHKVFNGNEYIFADTRQRIFPRSRACFLMPDYDEYGMGYKDRSLLFNPLFGKGGNDYSHWLIVDGQIAGTWNPLIKSKIPEVSTAFFASLSKSKMSLVKQAVKRYLNFLNN